MKYFAYGSNMSLRRLRERVPGAERLGIVSLVGHSLRFHKVSIIDGSAKCDAFFTSDPGDTIFGALYEIPEFEKDGLDEVEGLGKGYEEKNVLVFDELGQSSQAFTYFATIVDPSLLPYSWYVYHVVRGAKEIGVPARYLEVLINTSSQEDSDRARDARERAIYPV